MVPFLWSSKAGQSYLYGTSQNSDYPLRLLNRRRHERTLLDGIKNHQSETLRFVYLAVCKQYFSKISPSLSFCGDLLIFFLFLYDFFISTGFFSLILYKILSAVHLFSLTTICILGISLTCGLSCLFSIGDSYLLLQSDSSCRVIRLSGTCVIQSSIVCFSPLYSTLQSCCPLCALISLIRRKMPPTPQC